MSKPLQICEIFSSIQGEGLLAGRRQIFIRLAECNLECGYCDTIHAAGESCRVETGPGTGSFDELPQPLSPETLLGIVSVWQSRLPGAHHSISVTGGEPLLQAEALGECLPRLRRLLPIHLETNGTLPAELERVVENLDYISMDMKLPSTAGGTGDLWDRHRLFLKGALGRNVSVKVVITEDTPSEEILHVCNIIVSVDPATPLFLQPLSKVDGTVSVSAARLLHLQEAAAARLPDVRVIPQMHRMLGAL